jgi:hypothetical protein
MSRLSATVALIAAVTLTVTTGAANARGGGGPTDNGAPRGDNVSPYANDALARLLSRLWLVGRALGRSTAGCSWRCGSSFYALSS